MQYWILRSEPDVYGWDDLIREGATEWNGVRNYTARNFLKTMQPGAVIVDSADLDTLGVDLQNNHAWINGKAVRVVAAQPGLRGLPPTIASNSHPCDR